VRWTCLTTLIAASKGADPAEISLQKAELMVTEGDLRLAETNLAAARKSGRLSDEQLARATKVTEEVGSTRESIKPMVADSITRTVAAFDAGKYGDVKATLNTLLRTGVELTAEQRDVVDSYQMRVVELEREQGKNFETGTALGLLQPGTVRRSPAPTTNPATPTETTTQPADAPKAAVASDQPPSAAPAATITPPPQTNPAPGQGDLLAQAMKAETQRLVAEADQAYDERRYSEAIRKYKTALASGRQYLSADEVKHSESRITDAEVAMKGNGGLSGSVSQQLTWFASRRRRSSRTRWHRPRRPWRPGTSGAPATWLRRRS